MSERNDDTTNGADHKGLELALTSNTELGTATPVQDHPFLRLMRSFTRDDGPRHVIVFTDGESSLTPEEMAAVLARAGNKGLAQALHSKSNGDQVLHIDAAALALEYDRRLPMGRPFEDPFFMPSGSMRGYDRPWPDSLYGRPEGYTGGEHESCGDVFSMLALLKPGGTDFVPFPDEVEKDQDQGNES